jgi:hypothetical protein
MGINKHQQRVWKDPELQIEQKKRFPVNFHCISSGFNSVNVPGSQQAIDQYKKVIQHHPVTSESPLKERDGLMSLGDPAGIRLPKPFVKT